MLALLLFACDRTAELPALPALPDRPPAAEAPARGEVRPLRELTIAFTGENRGEVEVCGCPTTPYGGLARRRNRIDQLRASGPPVFVLDAGDMLIKGEVSPIRRPAPERARAVLELALATGLDAWAPSASDRTVGGVELFAGSNAVNATVTGLPAAAVIERDNLRLGVVGVSAGPAALEAVRAAMLAEVDAWVVLSNADAETNLAIAEGIPAVGAVLATTGGEHDAPRATKGAPIVEAAERGRWLGELHVALGSVAGPWALEEGALATLEEVRESLWRAGDHADPRQLERRDRALEDLASDARGRNLVHVRYVPLGGDLDGPSGLEGKLSRLKERSAAAAARTAAEPATATWGTTTACAACHADRLAAWSFSPHARAYTALLTADKASDPECVPCHTTAWGEPGGNAALDENAMRTWRGVQCESCHGPLARHPDDPKATSRPVTAATCTGCHDRANSPGFAWEAYRKRVSCVQM
jgi:hypothetical protein